MALTAREVLALFSDVTTPDSGNAILMQGSQNVPGLKITVEHFLSWLQAQSGFVPSIGQDGNWWIAGHSTGVPASTTPPQISYNDGKLKLSTNGGTSWTVLVDLDHLIRTHVMEWPSQVTQTQAGTQSTPISLSANVLNVWSTAVTSLYVSLTAGQSGVENEYKLQFEVFGDDFVFDVSGTTLRWIEEPEWEDGYTYQVSILNGLAISAGWEDTES